MDEAVETGFEAIVVTVDAPRGGNRERDRRTGFKIPQELGVAERRRGARRRAGGDDRGDLRADGPRARAGPTSRTSPPSAACRSWSRASSPPRTRSWRSSTAPPGSSSPTTAAASSTAALATADALPEVVDAVDGRARCSSTAASAAASTSRSRWPSAPTRCWSAGPPSGASPPPARRASRRVLELLRDELELALALCGCASPAELTRAHVRRAPAASVYSV